MKLFLIALGFAIVIAGSLAMIGSRRPTVGAAKLNPSKPMAQGAIQMGTAAQGRVRRNLLPPPP